MPQTTPRQKIRQVAKWGEKNVEIKLHGDTFDDAAAAARAYREEHNSVFIHPFDDDSIIEGQGTVGLEILEALDGKAPDYIFLPIGGGGLASGVGAAIRQRIPEGAPSIIGVEPEGAPSMMAAFRAGQPVTLSTIDPFVDGAAVKRVGGLTFAICRELLTAIRLIPEGRVCSTCLQLYTHDGMVVEPAGALSVAALEDYADEIRGKTVVCIVSGSNNDVDRLAEIQERSLQYEGLKHYFLIRFPQRPGSLRDFLDRVLGPTDDVVRIEFLQKNRRSAGTALIGVELACREDYEPLIRNMKKHGVDFTLVNKDNKLFEYLV